MSESEPKNSDADRDEESASLKLGYCYYGKCDNKGDKASDFKMSKSRCESAGGKSWVYKGTCYDL